MKVLFLTLARINSIEVQGIYQDLLRKFRDNGHELFIVSPTERKYRNKTNVFTEAGVTILNVWTPNIQKTNILEKGITTLLLEYFYFKAIKKHLDYKHIDLILYSTPPITFTNLIKKIKKTSRAKTYLLLKDIFPQNAVDLNYLKFDGLLYKFFRNKEKVLYKISDFIGCMSLANLNYVLKNNAEIEINKLEINPNTIEVKETLRNLNIDLYKKYNIPKDKIVYIFGGNLGAPQGIEFLKQNIEYCKSIREAFFLIIGDGTEYQNVSNWIKNNNIRNALLIKELPKAEFDEIIKLSHVGLIFLNPKFTIPNFPSRILSYMQNYLPVICATDSVTDIGKIAVENNFGYNCLTSDCDAFLNYVIKLLNQEVRTQMGNNSYSFLIREYNTEITYNKIVNKINL